MKLKPDHIAFAVICIVILAVVAFLMPKQRPASSMTLTSRAFSATQMIPVIYTCDGKSTTPPLSFGNIPKGTKELALTIFDPDAPKSGFTHWVVVNIPANAPGLEDGKIPVGAKEGINGAGKLGYVGLCPPTGIHHYLFTLYAVDKNLTFPNPPDTTGLKQALNGHVIGRATLTAPYTKTSNP